MTAEPIVRAMFPALLSVLHSHSWLMVAAVPEARSVPEPVDLTNPSRSRAVPVRSA
jgi:hypothetical protein